MDVLLGNKRPHLEEYDIKMEAVSANLVISIHQFCCTRITFFCNYTKIKDEISVYKSVSSSFFKLIDENNVCGHFILTLFWHIRMISDHHIVCVRFSQMQFLLGNKVSDHAAISWHSYVK